MKTDRIHTAEDAMIYSLLAFQTFLAVAWSAAAAVARDFTVIQNDIWFEPDRDQLRSPDTNVVNLDQYRNARK